MKNIVVISPYDGDGKTTLIETVVGLPLQWYVSDINCDYLTGPIMCADIRYAGIQFRIFEVPAFKDTVNLSGYYGKEISDPVVIPLRDLLMNADLVVEIHDSTKKLILESLNDFFEMKVDGKSFDSDILYPKKMVVMTKCDLPDELITWYDNLSEKEKEEYNKRDCGNPNFGSYLAATMYDYNICAAMYLVTAAPADRTFEVSINDKDSLDELKDELYKYFRTLEKS